MKNDVIDLGIIGAKLEYLDGLCRAKKLAATEFKEACKAIGRDARVEASVLAKFVNARIAESTEKQAHDAEQLSLLFSEVGL